MAEDTQSYDCSYDCNDMIQTLERMAALWDNAKRHKKHKHYYVQEKHERGWKIGENNGLCITIAWMKNVRDSTKDEIDRRLCQIPKVTSSKKDEAYCWPRNKKGAKARAAWCRRQIQKLKKEQGAS